MTKPEDVVREALGLLLDQSLNFTGYVANEAHEFSLNALAALDSLVAERDEAVAALREANRLALDYNELAVTVRRQVQKVTKDALARFNNGGVVE